MTSETDICNLALQQHSKGPITSIDDQQSPLARRCKRLYPTSRDELLRLHVWKFAKRRVLLAAAATTPEFRFKYEYPLPTDFLRLHPDYEHRVPDDWEIEDSVNGTVLRTNDGGPLPVRYIRRITNPVLFDPLFTKALYLDMAAAMANAMTDSMTTMDVLEKKRDKALSDARMTNAIERYADDPPEDDWLLARR